MAATIIWCFFILSTGGQTMRQGNALMVTPIRGRVILGISRGVRRYGNCNGWLSILGIALLALSFFPSSAQTGPQQQIIDDRNIVNKIAQSFTNADAARFADLIVQEQYQLSAADQEKLKKLSEELGMTKEGAASFSRILEHVRTKAREISPDSADTTFYQEGDENGDNDVLKQAIAIYRALLSRPIGEFAPLDWAAIQNHLGNALLHLGDVKMEPLDERALDNYLDHRTNNAPLLQREVEVGSKTAQLREAIAAYREALKVRTRERVPLDWAITQNNLGNALLSLGEIEFGEVLLEEAVAAYREALKEWTQEHAPLDWAMAQNNLGVALFRLGERADAERRMALLGEAIVAYREALKERTRERVPSDWALTQNNLGSALYGSGIRPGEERGAALLEEAAAAHREALKVWTHEGEPIRWGMTQANLGISLLRLGDRATNATRLEEAVAAFHEALKEPLREHAPQFWGQTQNFLGNAFYSLGDIKRETTHREEAIAAYEKAAAAYKASQTAMEPVNPYWVARKHLAMTETQLKKLRGQSGSNEKAQAPR